MGKPVIAILIALLLPGCSSSISQRFVPDLATLSPDTTGCENALWGENPQDKQFTTTRRVVIADIPGPAVITMIHFALPNKSAADHNSSLSRDAVLRITWDDQPFASVECPMVDFFCDPAGLRDTINTALVNKKRGWNAYFPMPFAKHARVELVYDGPLLPGRELWQRMPCYSYVLYRKLDRLPENAGYFHANWRQELLPLGQRDYLALETTGPGKFIGWNVAIRSPHGGTYPVDENEKFYLDGESEPSTEFQGLEDSFGFSWGFPHEENLFPFTGWFPYKEGAAAYRFFDTDTIQFKKSLRVTIGFGKNEGPYFRRRFSNPAEALEISTVCYWYQPRPVPALPALPPAEKRAPAESTWKKNEQLPTTQSLRDRNVHLRMHLGRPEQEIILADKGFNAKVERGYMYSAFPPPIYHCRADDSEVKVRVTVPKNTSGLLRIYLIDPDDYAGGRKEELFLDNRSLGTFEKFTEGRWIDVPVSSQETSTGQLLLRAVNQHPDSNAVISIIEWTDAFK